MTEFEKQPPDHITKLFKKEFLEFLKHDDGLGLYEL